MSKEKFSKLKSLIGRALGISDWKLKADGHLDITADELTSLTQEYGSEFVEKFEKLLSQEDNIKSNNQNQTKMPKTLTLALVCAILGSESLQAADDGSVVMTEEQLGKIEAELKKLHDENVSAVSSLATANTAKEIAEKAMSDATKALDELGATVKEAGTTAEKIEAVRVKLAEKPSAPATKNQTKADQGRKVIEGADPVTAYAQGIV